MQKMVDFLTEGFEVIGVGVGVGSGVSVALGVGVGVGVGASCKIFTLIIGFEKLNPYAANLSQPSFSLTSVVAIDFWSLPVIETVADIGAVENPYRHLATSLRITKS